MTVNQPAVNKRRSVLLFTHLYLPSIGGVQRSVHNLAEGLRSRGHAVRIATSGQGRLGLPGRDGADPRILRLRITHPFALHWSETLRLRTADWLNRPALRSFCRANRCELVHCHLINADTRYAFAASRHMGAKVIVTLRGGETEHWLESHPRRVDYVRGVLEGADYVTAVSQALLDQACALLPEVAHKSQVVPNPSVLPPLGEGPTPWPRPYLLFAGRLDAMKDVGTLIDAYHRLQEPSRAPVPDLLLVGDGPERRALAQRARRGPGYAGVHFLGALPHTEVLHKIRGASLLALPSRSSEGCPNVVLESMALGTPVVVSNLPALCEAVGAGGSIFPRGDAAGLSACIEALLHDAALRDAQISRAHRRIDTRHALPRILDAYERIYAERISGA